MLYSPNTLSLNGTLQIDTAIAALAAVDTNPAALQTLETIRNIEEKLSVDSPARASELIGLFLDGDTVAAMKADITLGLELLSHQASSPEQKIAARALLEVMRAEQ